MTRFPKFAMPRATRLTNNILIPVLTKFKWSEMPSEETLNPTIQEINRAKYLDETRVKAGALFPFLRRVKPSV